MQGEQKYLVHDPNTEVVEAKASDMDDDRDPCGEPQPPVVYLQRMAWREAKSCRICQEPRTCLGSRRDSGSREKRKSQVGVAAGVMGRLGKG